MSVRENITFIAVGILLILGGIGLFYGGWLYSAGDPIGMFFLTPDNFNEEAILLGFFVGGAVAFVFGIGALGSVIFPETKEQNPK